MQTRSLFRTFDEIAEFGLECRDRVVTHCKAAAVLGSIDLKDPRLSGPAVHPDALRAQLRAKLIADAPLGASSSKWSRQDHHRSDGAGLH